MPRRREGNDALESVEVRILRAGRRLFLREGLAAVTTDRLAREARVSKSSIYRYFGDMSGVFEAVVREAGEALVVRGEKGLDTPAAFREAVIAFGERLLELLNSEESVRLDRMVHESARTHPDIARRYYEATYEESHQELTRLLETGLERGWIEPRASARELAGHLLSSWEGLAFVRARLGLVETPYRDPRAWSTRCVHIVLGASQVR